MKPTDKMLLRRLESRYWRLRERLDTLDDRFNEVFETKTELKK